MARRKTRAVRPAGEQVAACDTHLPLAMDRVTSPPDGDTHLVVRRLSPGAPGGHCVYAGNRPHDARWLLIPQAVIA